MRTGCAATSASLAIVTCLPQPGHCRALIPCLALISIPIHPVSLPQCSTCCLTVFHMLSHYLSTCFVLSRPTLDPLPVVYSWERAEGVSLSSKDSPFGLLTLSCAFNRLWAQHTSNPLITLSTSRSQRPLRCPLLSAHCLQHSAPLLPCPALP